MLPPSTIATLEIDLADLDDVWKDAVLGFAATKLGRESRSALRLIGDDDMVDTVQQYAVEIPANNRQN